MVDNEISTVMGKKIIGLLAERFEDEFVFGPIRVEPRVDLDGEDYLQTYIVFEGDQTKLDPIWTIRLSDALWSESERLGYPGYPIQLFVKKSEWRSLEKILP